MKNRQLIERIYTEKAKDDSNSKDLARTLNVLSKTVFGDVNRFVFELLQNADDSHKNGQETITVTFNLLDDYVVFSHDGAHFTPEDVIGISSVGSKTSRKDKDAAKTGYKGIGFKSVFGTSDYVHIVSGGFSFRFDKNYELWADNDHYPWQVIPIWTDLPTGELAQITDPARVNTIIRVNNRERIKNEILNVFQDCQILLFLRRVHQITFCDEGKVIFRISKVQTDNTTNLYKGSKLISSWIIRSFDLNITEELHKRLNRLSDTECPQKLKEAKRTTLTFAANVEKGQLAELKNVPVYSYLPTKANKGFGYLINADFLTNAERTDLMSNAWNEFLFMEIARKQLEWFAEIMSTGYRKSILNLLKGKYSSSTANSIEKAFNTSIELAAAEIPFLPDQNSDRLTAITDTIVDSIRLSEYLDARHLIEYFEGTDDLKVIDTKIEGQSGLVSLGAKNFTFNILVSMLEGDIAFDTTEAKNLIIFLYNHTDEGKNSPWLLKLPSVRFIMDQNGCLKSPNEIFFPIESSKQFTNLPFENLSFVDKDVLKYCSKWDVVIKWLEDLGVRKPTNLEIVRKAIFPIISEDGIDSSNNITITRFIFKTFLEKVFSDGDYEQLTSLKLLTSDGLHYPRHCYFPVEYIPERDLSKIIPNANYVIPDYVEDKTQLPEWRSFLKKIGVRENISVEVIEDKIERTKFIREYPYAQDYLNWLYINGHYPSVYHRYKDSGQHYIKNFTSIDFREHLGLYEFSKMFWRKMLDNWSDFAEKCGNMIYYHFGGQELVPSFLEYYINTHPSIPCTDGNCYPSTNVYAPSLKTVVGTYFPVADFPVSITVAQIDFFGFKRFVSIPECLEILERIQELEPSQETIEQIFAVYEVLIGLSGESSKEAREAIACWRENARLLALDNTFQDIGELSCFIVDSITPPVNSPNFIKLPKALSGDEAVALCHLLDIPIVTFNDLVFVAEGETDDKTFKSTLLNKAKFLAVISAQNTGASYSVIYKQLTTAIERLNMKKASSLSFQYKDADGRLLYNARIAAWHGKSGFFYYSGRWNAPMTLYGLSSSLCALLSLAQMEREMGMFLQLTDVEAYEWLEENSYNVEEIDAADESIDVNIEDWGEPETDEDDLEITITRTSKFAPQIKASEVDYSNVVVQTNDIGTSVSTSQKDYKKLEEQDVMTDIGRWAEEFAYEFFKRAPEQFDNLRWMNADGESGLPYDFKLCEYGIEKTIEIKGTPSDSKDLIYLSAAEWRQIFIDGENYVLFKVFAVGTPDARIVRIDNIAELIMNGDVLSPPVELRV